MGCKHSDLLDLFWDAVCIPEASENQNIGAFAGSPQKVHKWALSTRLCALTKHTPVENYIVNSDLYLCCEPPNYYKIGLVHHGTQCTPLVHRQKVSVYCLFHVNLQKMENVGVTPTSKKR